MLRYGCATIKKEKSTVEYRAIGEEKIDLEVPESLNIPER